MTFWRTDVTSGADHLTLLSEEDDEEENDLFDNHEPVALRGYQQKQIDACLQALKDGFTRLAVSSPTGSGKTITFVSLIEQMPVPKRGRDQTLIIVHNLELAKQARETIARVIYRRCSVGMEQGAQHAYGNEEMYVSRASGGEGNADQAESLQPGRASRIRIDCASSTLHDSNWSSWTKRTTLQPNGASLFLLPVIIEHFEVDNQAEKEIVTSSSCDISILESATVWMSECPPQSRNARKIVLYHLRRPDPAPRTESRSSGFRRR